MELSAAAAAGGGGVRISLRFFGAGVPSGACAPGAGPAWAASFDDPSRSFFTADFGDAASGAAVEAALGSELLARVPPPTLAGDEEDEFEDFVTTPSARSSLDVDEAAKAAEAAVAAVAKAKAELTPGMIPATPPAMASPSGGEQPAADAVAADEGDDDEFGDFCSMSGPPLTTHKESVGHAPFKMDMD